MKWIKHLDSYNIDTTLFVNEPDKPKFHKAIRVIGLSEKTGKYEMIGNNNGIAFSDSYKCNEHIKDLDSWKYDKALKGIVFKESGIILPCGNKLICIDLDMKDKPDKGISFSDEERKENYLKTLELFGIDKNYSEQEITGNKGIHIFVKVKPKLLNFAYGKINLGKAEIEIFTRSRGIVTAPSEKYLFWKKGKDEQYLQPEKLIELTSFPEVEEEAVESRITTIKSTSGGNVGEVASWEHEQLYRACIGGDLGELKSLRVKVEGRRIILNRYSTKTFIKLFRETDNYYKIDDIRIGDNREYMLNDVGVEI